MGLKEGFYQRMKDIIQIEDKYIKKLPIGNGIKYAIFSDLHLGNGTSADNFRQNKNTFMEALSFYKREGYAIILLGDIEEFHQFDLMEIMSAYDELYGALRGFAPNNLHRVYGNHDMDWALEDPIWKRSKNIAWEAIKLGDHVLLTHGHQAEETYEKNVHVVRFGTTFYKYVETVLGPENQSTFTQIPGEKDRIYSEWAADNNTLLICGHTHNPIFASRSIFDWISEKIARLDIEIPSAPEADREKMKDKRLWLRNKRDWFNRKKEVLRLVDIKLEPPNYFNAGGCIYYDGLTNIEIDGSKIRLIYWENKEIVREIIWNEMDMNAILNRTLGTDGQVYVP
jgi:UDP-2,3-diacylglucosamine pyrophosphatase LpxH